MNRPIAWCVMRSTAIPIGTPVAKLATMLTALIWLSIALGSATIASAQVVQLPSQHVISSTGSVLVPDGGTADLGGIGRSRQGSVQSGFGPLSNRASGGITSGSTMSVSVRIIDLEALDEAILAGASPRGSEATSTTAASTTSTTSTTSAASAASTTSTTSAAVARPPDRAPSALPGSSTSARVGADPGRWQRELSGGSPSPVATNLSLLESDIRYFVQLGERAERAGSYQAARVYFQMARKAMTPELEARYQRAVSARAAEAAARLKADQEGVRRKF